MHGDRSYGYDPSAEDALPDFETLTGPPADPDAALARLRDGLGLPGSRPSQRRPPGPDVTGLAEALGLR